MTEAIPYADYVRIEIHAGGKAQIIEFKKADDRGKIRAEVTIPDRPARDAGFGGLIRQVPLGGVELTFKVSGPQATRITRDSDR